MSDDGHHAITIIALLGSVFSPYYAAALARGPCDPLNHCSVNIALYGPERDHWALTERGADAVRRDSATLAIGPSSMEWDGSGLRVSFDEITSPFASRIKGSIHVRPRDVVRQPPYALDASGKHIWAPISTCAAAEVTLSRPSLRWRGIAYIDSNRGDEPLARAFSGWTWSRACNADRAAVTYDVERVDGTRLQIAKSFDANGTPTDLASLSSAALGRTRWGLDRRISVDSGTSPRLLRTLEDTPFYARSLVSASFEGQPAKVLHEALSLTRFQCDWVRFLLPFRMRRASL